MDDDTAALRRCTSCRQRLPVKDFNKGGRWCPECLRLQAGRRRAVDYELELARQLGGCAICHRPPLPHRHLDLDHDHQTGRFRGLLCPGCNTMLGNIDENPAILLAAIEYLQRPGRDLRLPYMKRNRRPYRFPVEVTYRTSP